MKFPIFLDNHSTTPMDPRVLEAMLPYFIEKFGNAASRNHAFGWEAEEAVERARKQIGRLIRADAKEIVFTSGATESDNLALKGVLEMYKEKGNHIITTSTEHRAVLDTAKSLEAKERLQEQFKNHSAGRTYVAVVEGRVVPDSFTIRSFLAENRAMNVYSTKNSRAGKLAVTHVRVLKRSAKHSCLEIRLETGRKHQIRVHLAERGHAIVGDRNYGGASNPIKRLALHGTTLEFRHPKTRQLMKFESRYPKSFNAL